MPTNKRFSCTPIWWGFLLFSACTPYCSKLVDWQAKYLAVPLWMKLLIGVTRGKLRWHRIPGKCSMVDWTVRLITNTKEICSQTYKLRNVLLHHQICKSSTNTKDADSNLPPTQITLLLHIMTVNAPLFMLPCNPTLLSQSTFAILQSSCLIWYMMARNFYRDGMQIETRSLTPWSVT
jgi:hypothetical protein